MIELVLTVCLLSAPGSCHEERPGFIGDSLTSCMTQGQFYAVRWLVEHPAFQLSRWSCRPSLAFESPA